MSSFPNKKIKSLNLIFKLIPANPGLLLLPQPLPGDLRHVRRCQRHRDQLNDGGDAPDAGVRDHDWDNLSEKLQKD